MLTVDEQIRRNVFYSIAEYAAQPLMMIVAAPMLLHALGTEEYGIWMLVNSISATVSALGGGFGDAATKHISHHHGRNDRAATVRALTAALTLNCLLGLLCSGIMAAIAPRLVARFFGIPPALQDHVILAVRISAIVLMLRFAEVVFSSTIRACQNYRPSVIVTLLARLTTICASIVLARRGLVAILLSFAVVGCLSLLVHATIAIRLTGFRWEWVRGFSSELRAMRRFGLFTWIKSVAGVSFSHADRLLVASMLGVGPLSYYVLCSQITQPIHALLASAFNFLFPTLSARSSAGDPAGAKRLYHSAQLASMVSTIALCLPLALFSRGVLTLWLGPEIARQCYTVLTLMSLATGLLALSIVPHYAALALGRSRSLALVSLVAGAGSIAVGIPLLETFGILGGAGMRLVSAIISLVTFSVAASAFSASDRSSVIDASHLLPSASEIDSDRLASSPAD